MFRGPVRRTARRSARRTTRRVVRRRMLVPGRRYRRRRILVGGAALLLVGGAAYKIGQSEAQQIQQYTGRPPEDLSQEELENAMDQLGIQEQELSAADQAAIDAEAVPSGSPAPGQTMQPGIPSAPAGSTDYIAQLERLADLRDRGILTPEEFEAKKKQILGL